MRATAIDPFPLRARSAKKVGARIGDADAAVMLEREGGTMDAIQMKLGI